jgi:hypothetical protein
MEAVSKTAGMIPAGLSGGDLGAGVQAGRGEAVEEVAVVEVDHHGGSGAAVVGQPVGGQVFDQLGEGCAEAFGPVQVTRHRVVDGGGAGGGAGEPAG